MNNHTSADTYDNACPVRYRWVVFSVLALIYLLVFFHRQAPAVLALDLMRDLDLKGSSMGLLSAAYFYPYALVQIPSGMITRKFGPLRTLCLFFALAGLGAVGFAFSDSFSMALVFRGLIGFGAAVVLVPVLEIISTWFSSKHFTLMFGLLIAVGGVGSFAGAGPLGHLDHLLGWRDSFLSVGLVSLSLVGLALLLVRDRPEHKGYPPANEAPLCPASSEPSKEHSGIFRQILDVLAVPALWPPTIWAFLSLGVFISFGGLWGGPYLMHVHGLTKIQAGHVLGMLAVGMILGGPLLGFLAVRVLKSQSRVLILSSLIFVFLTLWMMLDHHAMAPTRLYVWFGLLGLSTMAAVPISLTLVREAFPPELAGTATGIANFFFLAGGAIMQQLAGLLLDSRGFTAHNGEAAHYDLVFQAYLICAILALAASLFVGKLQHQMASQTIPRG